MVLLSLELVVKEVVLYGRFKSRTGCKTSSTFMVLLSLELVVKQVVLLWSY